MPHILTPASLSFTLSPSCHCVTGSACTRTNQVLRLAVLLRRNKSPQRLPQPVFPQFHHCRRSLPFTHLTRHILLPLMPHGTLVPTMTSRLPPPSMDLPFFLPPRRLPCRSKMWNPLLSLHPPRVGHPRRRPRALYLVICVLKEPFLIDASHSIARLLPLRLCRSALRRRIAPTSLWVPEEVGARDPQALVGF